MYCHTLRVSAFGRGDDVETRWQCDFCIAVDCGNGMHKMSGHVVDTCVCMRFGCHEPEASRNRGYAERHVVLDVAYTGMRHIYHVAFRACVAQTN